jgi:hypothetical protein
MDQLQMKYLRTDLPKELSQLRRIGEMLSKILRKDKLKKMLDVLLIMNSAINDRMNNHLK